MLIKTVTFHKSQSDRFFLMRELFFFQKNLLQPWPEKMSGDC